MIPQSKGINKASSCSINQYINSDFDKVQIVAENIDAIKKVAEGDSIDVSNKQNKSFSFESGGSLAVGDEYVPIYFLDNTNSLKAYLWKGSLPKVVTANSTPETSGGIADNAWVLISPNTGSSTGGISDAPNDGFLYARKSSNWVKPVTDDIEPTINRMYWDNTLANTLNNKLGDVVSSGSGESIGNKQGTSNVFLKKLVAGSNINFSVTPETITISSTGSGGTGGEINTASNIGTGLGVYKEKVGTDLKFKSLKYTGSLTISINGEDELVFNVPDFPNLSGYMIKTNYDPQNLQSNVYDRSNHTGTQGINTIDNLSTVLDSKQQSLVSGTNIKTINNESILGAGNINITGSGGESTASNLGTGIQLFSSKVGSDLQFRTISNVGNSYFLFEQGVNEVTLNTSGLATAFNNKVDTVAGKSLSANDFTNTYKSKLDGIQAGAQVNPTSYSWSTGITGKPSTLSGYGITDGISSTNSGLQTMAGSLELNGVIKYKDVIVCNSAVAQIRYNATSNGIRIASDGVMFYTMPKPSTNGGLPCGTASYRWSTVYAQTGTIDTSDARLKTDVRSLTEAEKLTALEIKQSLGFYKWLASIELKGEKDARLHCGTTVQKVIECFKNNGLNPFDYGIVCYDATDTITKEDGTIETVDIDIYSLRPTQLALFLIAAI